MSGLEYHPVAGVFPLMVGNDFEALVDDIRAHGQRDPIWLHQDGRIIDGRNRARACERLGIEPTTQVFIGPDSALLDFVLSLNLHRRHLTESQRAMVAARVANLPQGARTDLAQICAKSQLEAAKQFEVGRRTLQMAQQVQRKGTERLVRLVDSGKVAVSDATTIVDLPAEKQDELVAVVEAGVHQKLRQAYRKADIEEQRRAIKAGTAKLPEGKFEVIVIDPPWPYGWEDSYDPDYYRVSSPYPEMSLDEIAALPIPAADDCVMWLWTTHRFIWDSRPLLEAWGFAPRVILTWAKATKSGDRQRFGVGNVLRSSSEFCVVATRGKPTINLTSQTTVLFAPTREHSRKPDEFYAMVESLCVGRKLDYFSREVRPGWEQFGNDPAKFVSANDD